MATVYGTNRTKVRTGPTSSNITDPGELRGKVRVMTDTYEASVVAAGSTIYMGDELPIGARILGITLAHDALGASSKLSVGVSGAVAKFLAAASSSSAGIRVMADDTTVDGLLYEITSSTRDVIITTSGASITGTVKLIVFYTAE